jgi:hypothetical protein
MHPAAMGIGTEPDRCDSKQASGSVNFKHSIVASAISPHGSFLLFHRIPAAIEAGAHRPLIVRALLAHLSCTGRGLNRIVSCLAYSPAVTIVTVRCLFLFALAFAGIEE